MSPPLLAAADEDEGDSQMALLASPASMNSHSKNTSELRERNYMGLSGSPPSDSSNVSTVLDESKICLNLKATELRLGPPGSQSPKRDLECTRLTTVKSLFPLHPISDGHCVPQKNVVSGNKRGFSDAMEPGKFPSDSDTNLMLSPRHSAYSGSKSSSVLVNLGDQFNNGKESAAAVKETKSNLNESTNNNSNAPVSKAHVVGWPPVRSFRKNSLASTSKNADEAAGKASGGAVLVKVSMDGAPYLRKVDLKNYRKYEELSSALEKMFSCFTIGQYGSHEASGRESMSESNLKDLLHGSEYVLTYEDKDGDWLLVGDVPWVMFTNTCKKLRIMKGSDAIGLAPRAVEKCRNRN